MEKETKPSLAGSDAYDYSPLSELGNIRLIRLMAHEDKEAPIQCQLFEYPLKGLGQGAHLYEALSYVWGSEEDKKPIYVQEPDGKGGNSLAGKTRQLHVTQNLHALLSHIRNCLFDRVVWVDAICINQQDNKEKEPQVQSMAKIYASANRVIVWLGEASSDTDGAFEALCKSAAKEKISPSTPQPILALLERPWFRRIWVLQEVAVARQILIKCGLDEMDGSAFCSGLDASKLPYDTRPDLRTLVPPITYLIRHVPFWPQTATSHPGALHSLVIRPLGQLVDMYHTREATNPLDKVYALLGIGSCDPTKLSADYGASWEAVFEKLIKLSLSDQVSVGVWGDKRGVAVIRGKGRVLGKVSSVQGDDTRGDIQHIGIAWKNSHGGFDTGENGSAPFPLQASAKAIREGDAICLLEGAAELTVIRPCNGCSAIIVIQAPLARTNSEWPEHLQRITAFPTDLVLVWDWEVPQYEQDRDYESFMGIRGGFAGPQLPSQGCLDKIVRLWNFGVLLNTMERYEDSSNKLGKAAEMYGTTLGSTGTYPDHSTRVGVDEEALSVMDHINRFKDAEKGIEGWVYHPPLQWAVDQGHKAMVRVLLEGGADVDVKDRDGWTPLHTAAHKGREAMVGVLLEGGADIEAKGDDGLSPLQYAAFCGHEAIVRVLLEGGADIEVKDENGRTPLQNVAAWRREAVVRVLLEGGAKN
ncbi:hypothetical protein OQA88_1259 [Cercophora sp. LCS_1]